MLGISYGEFFVLLGATAALLGPKDLPLVARAAGRLAGRAIGYVQLARGQLDNAMHKSQFSQVHKELQDTMAQLEAIRYEIRSVSIMNPGPFTRRLDGSDPSPNNDTSNAERSNGESRPLRCIPKEFSQTISISSSLQSQATVYAKFAEAQSMNSSASKVGGNVEKLNDDSGLLVVLPVSAESAGFLPKHSGLALRWQHLYYQRKLQDRILSWKQYWKQRLHKKRNSSSHNQRIRYPKNESITC